MEFGGLGFEGLGALGLGGLGPAGLGQGAWGLGACMPGGLRLGPRSPGAQALQESKFREKLQRKTTITY